MDEIENIENTQTEKTPIHHAVNPSRKSLQRTILATLLFIVTFVGTAAGLIYHELQSSVTTVNVNALIKTKKNAKPVDSYDGKPINILVIGSDVRSGQNSRFGNEQGMRSDTTLLVHVNADRKHAQVISIPRDTLVNIPQCQRADGTIVPAMAQTQFNAAFAYGGLDNNIASATACTISTVEAMTGITIDEFIVVDFSGFMNVVNSLGGVKYCFDQPINDPLSELNVPAGCHVLDGFQALALARARYSLGDGSDISRMDRQQQLIAELIKTAKTKNMLTDMPALFSFAKSSLQTLTTSEQFGSLTTLGGLAYSLRNIEEGNIQFLTMPVMAAPQDPNRLVATQEANQIWELLKTDTPIPTTFAGLKKFNQTEQTQTDQSTQNGQNTQGQTNQTSTTNQ